MCAGSAYQRSKTLRVPSEGVHFAAKAAARLLRCPVEERADQTGQTERGGEVEERGGVRLPRYSRLPLLRVPVPALGQLPA